MPRSLSTSDIALKNSLYYEAPWRWLYEIRVPTDPATRLRLCRDVEQIVFGSSTGGSPNVYYPASIAHGVSRQDTEATLPTVDLTLSNISREVQIILEQHSGLVGERVRILLVNKNDVAGGGDTPTFADEFEILEVAANERTITAKLGQFSLFSLSFPNTRYVRNHCGFQYKGSLCQYSGALPTCDKTLNGSDGCVVHDNADRFGGEPGIPRISAGGLT